jgi:hypothetical protein
MRETVVVNNCDNCSKEIDPNVQPRVVINDMNEAAQMEFCDYACLATWATERNDGFVDMRKHHLDVTITQLNDSLLRAYQLETGQIELVLGDNGEVLREYASVESVPLHPLVELHRQDDGTPYVVLKELTA